MQVDAIEERPRDPRAIAMDLLLGTLTSVFTEVATRTGIRCLFAIDASGVKT